MVYPPAVFACLCTVALGTFVQRFEAFGQPHISLFAGSQAIVENLPASFYQSGTSPVLWFAPGPNPASGAALSNCTMRVGLGSTCTASVPAAPGDYVFANASSHPADLVTIRVLPVDRDMDAASVLADTFSYNLNGHPLRNTTGQSDATLVAYKAMVKPGWSIMRAEGLIIRGPDPGRKQSPVGVNNNALAAGNGERRSCEHMKLTDIAMAILPSAAIATAQPFAGLFAAPINVSATASSLSGAIVGVSSVGVMAASCSFNSSSQSGYGRDRHGLDSACDHAIWVEIDWTSMQAGAFVSQATGLARIWGPTDISGLCQAVDESPSIAVGARFTQEYLVVELACLSPGVSHGRGSVLRGNNTLSGTPNRSIRAAVRHNVTARAFGDGRGDASAFLGARAARLQTTRRSHGGQSSGDGGELGVMFSSLRVVQDLPKRLYPAVLGPVVNGGYARSQALGVEHEDDFALGILDVTKPPFFAGASGNNASWNAFVLQQAVYYAVSRNLMVYLPSGNYTVDHPIVFQQGGTLSPNYSPAVGWNDTEVGGDARNAALTMRGQLRAWSHPGACCGESCARRSSTVRIWRSRSVAAGSSSSSLAAPVEARCYDAAGGVPIGDATPRATLVVPANSPAFSDAKKVTAVLQLLRYDAKAPVPSIAYDKSNDNMNQVITSVDVSVGPGNFGAAGIRARGAQGCDVEDVVIDLGPDGAIGLSGVSGSGGMHAAVTVRGGRWAADLRFAQPAAAFSMWRMENQACGAFVFTSQGGATLIGANITRQSSAVRGQHLARFLVESQGVSVDDAVRQGTASALAVPVITAGGAQALPGLTSTDPCYLPNSVFRTDGIQAHDGAFGSLSVIDTVIDISPESELTASYSRLMTVLEPGVMQNVFVRGLTHRDYLLSAFAWNANSSLDSPMAAVAAPPEAIPSEWISIGTASVSEQPAPHVYKPGHAYTYDKGVFFQAQRMPTNYSNGVTTGPGIAPASDLTSKHGWGLSAVFPSFESPGVANVALLPYSAPTDGSSDAWPGVSAAISAACHPDNSSSIRSGVVLIPRGTFRVSKAIEVPPGCSLVGIDTIRSYVYFDPAAPRVPFVLDLMQSRASTARVSTISRRGALIQQLDHVAACEGVVAAGEQVGVIIGGGGGGGTSGLWQPRRALFGIQVIVPQQLQDTMGAIRWNLDGAPVKPLIRFSQLRHATVGGTHAAGADETTDERTQTVLPAACASASASASGPEVFRQMHAKWKPVCSSSVPPACESVGAVAAVPLIQVTGSGSGSGSAGGSNAQIHSDASGRRSGLAVGADAGGVTSASCLHVHTLNVDMLPSSMNRDFRMLRVSNVSCPTRFYHVNTEHAESDANFEVVGSRSVTVYSIKSEGRFAVLWLRNTTGVHVSGYGGNACPFEVSQGYPSPPPGQLPYANFTPSIFRLEQATSTRLVAVQPWGMDGTLSGGHAVSSESHHTSGLRAAIPCPPPDTFSIIVQADGGAGQPSNHTQPLVMPTIFDA